MIENIFIHLHIHSSYSLLESSISIDQIIDFAKKKKLPAIALTDKNNLFGALEFTEKCFQNGIQPIIGCDFCCDFEDEDSSENISSAKKNQLGSLVLLAQNEKGYQNLMKLSTMFFLNEENEDGSLGASIKIDWLKQHCDGLIALSSGEEGALAVLLKQKKVSLAHERFLLLQKIFKDRFYIQLQRYEGYDRYVENQLIEMAYKFKIPLVAANESYFLNAENHEAHEVLLAISDGVVIDSDRSRHSNKSAYLKSPREMKKLFSDLPEAIENTIEIPRRCSAYTPVRDPILPQFSKNEKQDLRQKAKEGLAKRLEKQGCALSYKIEDYQERLDYELKVIENMGFSGYFLIVADFIQWAKSQNIPVGPGRGSGAGSLVAYALTITDIDPLRFSLLFERFLNPERVSMPDFDIDFCQDGRERVIEYVTQKYGSKQVAQIITFGSLQARGVLRDVGRSLGMPYQQVDQICKLIPQEIGTQTSLRQILQMPELRKKINEDPKIEDLYRISQNLEGLFRHASTHAAGIVIGDRDLSELVPLYRDPNSSMQVTQFNMKYAEKSGMVKFDFLGLKTLSILKETLRLIHKKNIDIQIDSIPLDDQKTYELLGQARSLGIFQLESAGMRDTLKQMRPDCIEDIIALVALYRPGPMENIPLFTQRKHEKKENKKRTIWIDEKIDYLLEETQGVIVYQEQVMQIAQILAGYSLGEADLLRRAMGKKIRSEMELQRSRFEEGAIKNGIEKNKAIEIFDLLAKFADYGFNKSHAAAYAFIAYQTAYLKTHFPLEFIAASMTYEINHTEKLNELYQESKDFDIDFVSPSVNESSYHFDVANDKIYYALAAIKGVGLDAAQHICETRGDKKFKDIIDFFKRIDKRKVNKRALEGLIKAGAMDSFGIERDALIENIERLNKQAQSFQEMQNETSQNLLFSDQEMFANNAFELLPTKEVWKKEKILAEEFNVLGFYLTGHPLDRYKFFLKSYKVKNYQDILKSEDACVEYHIAGVLISESRKRTKEGRNFSILLFSDFSTTYELPLFEDKFAKYKDILEPGKAYLLKIYKIKKDDKERISLEDIKELKNQKIIISFSKKKNPNLEEFFKFLESCQIKDKSIEEDLIELHVNDTLPGKDIVKIGFRSQYKLNEEFYAYLSKNKDIYKLSFTR